MTKYPAFLDSEYQPVPLSQAAFCIIPCPFERTTSYGKGTLQGPLAILLASRQLEAMEMGISPGEGGFYTAPPVDCNGNTEEVLLRIEKAVKEAIAAGAIPILLGGEHTITLGAIAAFREVYKQKNQHFGLVQFDAHADLRYQYEGNTLSHACVMRRVLEDMGVPIVQFAIRDISKEEEEIRKAYGITSYDAWFLGRVGLPEQPLPEDFPKDIYISFDLDALDSSLMPATGTPSPGGINWRETQFILEKVIHRHNVIGFDVVELAPIPNLHHADFTAAKLVHLIMALIWQERKK